MIHTGWRIADPVYSNTPEQMLSGQGAFLYGGRWNSPGYRCVYLGSSLALAALELLVHLDNIKVLQVFKKMAVSFDENLILEIEEKDLPGNWSQPSMTTSVQATGDDWLQKQSSLILKVPSAVIQGECNYLLNPAHPDFSHIRCDKILTFNYDPRLKR